MAQILVLTFCDLEVVGLNPAMCMAFFTSLSLLISSSISQLLLLSRSLKEEQNYRRLHQNRCLTVQLGANQANCANSLKPHEHLLLKVPKLELDFNVCVDPSMLSFQRNCTDMSKPNVKIKMI